MNIIRKQRQGSKGGPTPPVEIIFFNNLIQSDFFLYILLDLDL